MGKFLALLLLLAPNAFAMDAAQSKIMNRLLLESKAVADQATFEMGPCEGHAAMIRQMAKHRSSAACPEVDQYLDFLEKRERHLTENCRDMTAWLVPAFRDPMFCENPEAASAKLREFKISGTSDPDSDEEGKLLDRLPDEDLLVEDGKTSSRFDCDLSVSLAMQFRKKHSMLASQNYMKAETAQEEACAEGGNPRAIDDYLDYLRYGEKKP